MSIPDGAVAAARHAYVAHRFEPNLIGFHPQVHVYDLTSAYSWALTTIPCLAHGKWYQCDPDPLIDEHASIGTRLVEWHIPASKRMPWGPFPWRYGDGATCYPLHGAAWVWHPEYKVALQIWGPKSFTVHDAWSFVPSCDHHPWDAVLDLLPKRAGFPGLKKMLNSIPGKLAQSRPRPGPWFDPLTAGLVTATVRARMLSALAIAGPHAIGCVADALWVTKSIQKLNIASNGEPGNWRHKIYKDVLFVQPGLSFGDPDEEHPWGRGLASQGTPAVALNGYAQPFHEAWASDGLRASLEIEYDHFIGITEGVTANIFDLIGTTTRARHEVRFDPLRKRNTEQAKPIEARASYYMTTNPPHSPDPDYFYLTGQEPARIGNVWLSAPYWGPDWSMQSPEIESLWPTEADELVP